MALYVKKPATSRRMAESGPERRSASLLVPRHSCTLRVAGGRADKLQVATSRHDVCGPREACAGAAVPLSDRPGAWLATTGGGWAAGAASAAVPCVVRSRTELRNLVVGVKKPPKILRSG